MMYQVTVLLVLVGLGLAYGLAVPVEGDNESNLRMHPVQETTTWVLLEDMYLYQNAIRYYHDTNGLRFNRTLTDYARLKALILAWYDGSAPEAGGDLKFGENIHWSPTGANASDIIESWYFQEEPKWNYDAPVLSDETKDFSQLLWNATTKFGCGQAASKGQRGGTYTVCYYEVPGNVAGQEAANVSRPRKSEEDSEEAAVESTAAPSEQVAVESTAAPTAEATTRATDGRAQIFGQLTRIIPLDERSQLAPLL